MAALEAVLLALILAFPRRQGGARQIRESGAAVRQDQLGLEHSDRIIGYYDGCEIHACVEYMGLLYRFDRVVLPSYRHRVGARELFVEPGLLYLTD